MKNPRKRKLSIIQIISIIIIVACTIIVIATVIITNINKPETVVKAKIAELSADYYENYLYEKFDFKNASEETMDEFMKKYEKAGLSITSLRQILLYDHQKNADEAPFLKKYCDEDHTYVKFYPEHPYSKTSYRAEYTYSCEF